MATPSTDYELAELVGEALAEVSKSVRELVDVKEAQINVRQKWMEAEFEKFRSEQVQQTKALWDKAAIVQQSAAERADGLTAELKSIDLRTPLDALQKVVVADQERIGEQFRKALAEAEERRQKSLTEQSTAFRQELNAVAAAVPPPPDFTVALQEMERRLADRLEAIKAELRAEFDPAAWIGQLAQALQTLPAPLLQPSFNVPQAPPPNIDVHVPPPRLIRKVHEYDQYNRPVITTDQELKEPNEP